MRRHLADVDRAVGDPFLLNVTSGALPSLDKGGRAESKIETLV